MSTTQQATETGRDQRAANVAEAIHSSEMEGLPVDADTRTDMGSYVDGTITADELVQRVRTRYGLA